MPYATNEDLPERIKAAIPSKKGKDLFRQVFNSQAEAGRSETVAFASAWAALQNAGFDQNDNGKWVKKRSVLKAEYQGREVELNKPFRLPDGSSKKFGVYVKDGDSVKRVTFGSPDMEIRRDDPEARANFRARHNCDQKTDKTTAGYWSCKMWESGNSVSEILDKEDDVVKRRLNDDIYTRQEEAMARSFELGFDGKTHVHQIADGQAVYMPGESHDEYLRAFADEEEPDESQSDSGNMGLIRSIFHAILDTIMSNGVGKGVSETTVVQAGDILKADDEQRIVWGWASVISENGETVVDTQGDMISPEELTKAANAFMEDVRQAKAMHQGDQVGEVIHSLPLTKELGEALGIESDREGWIVAMKVHDDETWEKVKSGELGAFSIGGSGMRELADG